MIASQFPEFPGNFLDVPLLIGDNKDDGILFMADFLRHPHKYGEFTESLPLLLFNKASSEVTSGDLRLVEMVKK